MAYLMDNSGRQELANRLNSAMLGKEEGEIYIKVIARTHIPLYSTARTPKSTTIGEDLSTSHDK